MAHRGKSVRGKEKKERATIDTEEYLARGKRGGKLKVPTSLPCTCFRKCKAFLKKRNGMIKGRSAQDCKIEKKKEKREYGGGIVH